MAMITNDWLPALQEEFKKPYYKELYQFVQKEYSTAVVYPPADDIFNALHLTPLKDRLHAFGQTCTEQDTDVDQSKASDLKSTASKSIVGIPWIFWL